MRRLIATLTRLRPLQDLRAVGETGGEEILAGLRATPKTLSPKYLYDPEGSRLFDRICDLPEYYPTRTETAILEANAREIAGHIGSGAFLIEYGSGSSWKTRILLDQLPDCAYAPIDISGEHLADSMRRLSEDYPLLEIWPVCADYMGLEAFPMEEEPPEGKRVLFFPGSTIGNLQPFEAVALLRRMRSVGGPHCELLLGVDLRKDKEVLENAYNDSQGVTAAFNLNLLRRLNREMDADFILDAFRHRAFFNEDASRIEMHLVSRRAQRFQVAGEAFSLNAGESIHTENSYKYDLKGFCSLLKRAGFDSVKHWTDARGYFSVHYCAARN